MLVQLDLQPGRHRCRPGRYQEFAVTDFLAEQTVFADTRDDLSPSRDQLAVEHCVGDVTRVRNRFRKLLDIGVGPIRNDHLDKGARPQM